MASSGFDIPVKGVTVFTGSVLVFWVVTHGSKPQQRRAAGPSVTVIFDKPCAGVPPANMKIMKFFWAALMVPLLGAKSGFDDTLTKTSHWK